MYLKEKLSRRPTSPHVILYYILVYIKILPRRLLYSMTWKSFFIESYTQTIFIFPFNALFLENPYSKVVRILTRKRYYKIFKAMMLPIICHTMLFIECCFVLICTLKFFCKNAVGTCQIFWVLYYKQPIVLHTKAEACCRPHFILSSNATNWLLSH